MQNVFSGTMKCYWIGTPNRELVLRTNALNGLDTRIVIEC